MATAPEPSQVSLIARAQSGDVRAFEDLVRQHVGQVRRFARVFARDHADADDLAQEALVKVYRSIRGYRFRSAFSTWLYAVTRNVFLDVVKSRAHRDRGLEEAYDLVRHQEAHGEAALPADARLEQEEERRGLWEAISRIPAEFRGTLVMFDIEGLSHEEIAAVERVAVGTVKSRLSRAREHLRRILARAGGKGQPGNLAGGALVSPAEGTKP